VRYTSNGGIKVKRLTFILWFSGIPTHVHMVRSYLCDPILFHYHSSNIRAILGGYKGYKNLCLNFIVGFGILMALYAIIVLKKQKSFQPKVSKPKDFVSYLANKMITERENNNAFQNFY
jgi:hypothetical protein